MLNATPSFGETHTLPSNISMHNLLFSWIKDCYNIATLKNAYGLSFEDSEKYISIVKKYLKKNNNIYIQDKQAVIDGVQLPYLYIDEKYKFARFIDAYSDKEVHIRLEGGNDFQPLYNIDLTLPSFYLKLLPYKNGAHNEYVLLVTKRGSDAGMDYGKVWFFKVLVVQDAPEITFTFNIIDKFEYDNITCEYAYGLIDKYSIRSFYDIPEGTKCESNPHTPVFDFDKKSEELYIYNSEDSSFGLRFIWNGERFVKKDLCKRDLMDAIIARRGEE